MSYRIIGRPANHLARARARNDPDSAYGGASANRRAADDVHKVQFSCFAAERREVASSRLREKVHSEFCGCEKWKFRSADRDRTQGTFSFVYDFARNRKIFVHGRGCIFSLCGCTDAPTVLLNKEGSLGSLFIRSVRSPDIIFLSDVISRIAVDFQARFIEATRRSTERFLESFSRSHRKARNEILSRRS